MYKLKNIQLTKLTISSTIHDWLLLSSAFSCLLLFVRMIVTGSIEYIFLPWNLFLALVPYWITKWMTNNVSIIESNWKLLIVTTGWLLFIPNSFYIITDLFHLTHVDSAPKWFDLLLIFSFAWNGIIAGVLSLRRIEQIAVLIKGKKFSIALVFVVMWLSAFGIYIGRFLRFNSWDIIADPFSLVGEIIAMILSPFANSFAWGMTLCYSVFMSLLYFTVQKLGEALAKS
ncbi:hypothetical protein CAP36_06115 [Chitinophagaceae bacterium IBVUCB2]|nr:hypothetical protein CAP36_06115 [Chitinophagaceae bacterium IBVUCB2]